MDTPSEDVSLTWAGHVAGDKIRNHQANDSCDSFMSTFIALDYVYHLQQLNEQDSREKAAYCDSGKGGQYTGFFNLNSTIGPTNTRHPRL